MRVAEFTVPALLFLEGDAVDLVFPTCVLCLVAEAVELPRVGVPTEAVPLVPPVVFELLTAERVLAVLLSEGLTTV